MFLTRYVSKYILLPVVRGTYRLTYAKSEPRIPLQVELGGPSASACPLNTSGQVATSRLAPPHPQSFSLVFST